MFIEKMKFVPVKGGTDIWASGSGTTPVSMEDFSHGIFVMTADTAQGATPVVHIEACGSKTGNLYQTPIPFTYKYVNSAGVAVATAAAAATGVTLGTSRTNSRRVHIFEVDAANLAASATTATREYVRMRCTEPVNSAFVGSVNFIGIGGGHFEDNTSACFT